MAVDAEIDAILERYGVPQPFPMVHPGRCVSAFDALCVHLGLKPPWEERYKALFGRPPVRAEVVAVAAPSSEGGITPGRVSQAPLVTKGVTMLKASSANDLETKTGRRRNMARKAWRQRTLP
jgi:hypothetical protein